MSRPHDQILCLLARIADRLDADAAALADAAGAAAIYGISRSMFLDLDSRGFVPERVTLGDSSCARWNARELRAHIDAGAPHRSRWGSMKVTLMRRAG
jgi:hypothetical protein